jgi:hypothetical protein
MKGLSRYATSLFFALLLLASFCVFAMLLSSCVPNVKEVVSVTAEGASVRQDSPLSQGGQWRTLPDEAVPLAALPGDETVSTDWQSQGGWSLANSVLSLIGLTEALLVVVAFLFRNKYGSPNFLTPDFMLKSLALFMAFVFLAATSITSDFTGSAVLFDKMSLPIIVLFVVQQIILFGVRAKEPIVLEDEEARKRFRARMRYED